MDGDKRLGQCSSIEVEQNQTKHRCCITSELLGFSPSFLRKAKLPNQHGEWPTMKAE